MQVQVKGLGAGQRCRCEALDECTLTTDDVKEVLRANEGRRVRLTWDDAETKSVVIAAVDDEGVLHSGPNGDELK